MGCTKSKLSNDVCLKDETSELHTKYINEHGLQSYYKVMGMPPQGPSGSPGSETDNSSKNLNFGLVNIEEKTTVDNNNNFYGLSVSDILEVTIGFLLFLYICRIIYKRIMKRRKQARASKNLEMKEIVKSVTQTVPTPHPQFKLHQQGTQISKTPMDFAIAKLHKNPQALMPIFGPDYLID